MNATRAGISARAEVWRNVIRRLLPRAVLFAGLALILIQHLHGRPNTVDVLYEYGHASRGLQGTRIAYLQDGELVRDVQFNYRAHGAGRTQRHAVRLLEGDYTVEVKLAYAGQPPSGLAGTRTRLAGGASEVTLRRPLLVRGDGELHVYVAGAPGGDS